VHVPFLVGAIYTSTGQTVSGMRLVILAGILRVLVRRERIIGGFKLTDRLMIAWGTWAIISAAFHERIGETLVLRLGLVYTCGGIYFLSRVFIRSLVDVRQLAKSLLVVIIPLAVGLVLERQMAHNWFALLGAPAEIAEDRIRDGKVRAMGPFSHPILAGTAGAVCLPFVITCWRKHRKVAIAGLIACLAIIGASGSSGPILTTMAAFGALALWMVRDKMNLIRWSAVLSVVGLAVVMNSPVYYLLSYIDLTGSSTGWHRAALIDAAVKNLSQWWMTGTDHTRHWMPTGIPANQNHTDITNVFLMMGVIGGLPLMLLFISVLVSAFTTIGKTLTKMKATSKQMRFEVWTLGAILFAHTATFVSVDYFDQTVVFYYLVLAAVVSVWAEVARQPKRAVARASADSPGVATDDRCGASPGIA